MNLRCRRRDHNQKAQYQPTEREVFDCSVSLARFVDCFDDGEEIHSLVTLLAIRFAG